MHKIVALVPMRHSSERVPGKNYRLFAGKPLYHHILRSLLNCPFIQEVVVDTDSSTIINGITEEFPRVTIFERPEHLRAGTIPMNEILLNEVKKINADFYIQTHSTNPLIKTTTISKAIGAFLKEFPTYDSLFSVTKIQTRLWDNLSRPINHNPAILLRTQDLPPIYEENSCIYLFSKDTLEKKHNRLGERPMMFEMDPVEAFDIDEELDFRIAEFLYMDGVNKK